MAIGATAVWEVRTTGADTNGGCYTSGGTDYSQQDAAQLTVADGACAGNTTVTSATGGFTAAMVGNGINIAGTIYEIKTHSDTNTITIDRNGPSASSLAMSVGGALATLNKVSGAHVLGNTIWAKGSFTCSASPEWAESNYDNQKAIYLRGYGTTRGDSGKATLTAYQNSTTMLYARMNGHISNMDLRGGGYTSVKGIETNSLSGLIHHCAFSNLAYGIYGDNSYSTIEECTFDTCTSAGVGMGGSGGGRCFRSYFTGCAVAFSGIGLLAGAIVNGGTVGASACDVTNCVFYGLSSYGVRQETGGRIIVNCVFAKCGTYGIYDLRRRSRVINCAFYNNSSGTISYDASASAGLCTDGLVVLTADGADTNCEKLFAAAATGDFRLTNTADYGAACRAAGIGPVGQTNAIDIGAVQHADPAGGGGVDLPDVITIGA